MQFCLLVKGKTYKFWWIKDEFSTSLRLVYTLQFLFLVITDFFATCQLPVLDNAQPIWLPSYVYSAIFLVCWLMWNNALTGDPRIVPLSFVQSWTQDSVHLQYGDYYSCFAKISAEYFPFDVCSYIIQVPKTTWNIKYVNGYFYIVWIWLWMISRTTK